MGICKVLPVIRGVRLLLMLLMLLFGVRTVNSQNNAHFRIRYVINRPEVDTTFVDNDARISDMRSFLERLRDDSFIRVRNVKFRGTASPDGGYEFNRWLSANRLRTFKELARNYITLPDSSIIANVDAIPWDEFRQKIVEADSIPHRDEVLAIIDEGPRIVPWFNNRHIDARLLKLKPMYKGTVWEVLKEPILRDLRYGEVDFEYYLLPSIPPPAPLNVTDPLEPSLPPIDIPYYVWMPRLHLKTNLIGLAMLSANIAVEVDLARHWSVTLPVYYCAMDWFKSTIKFRNFTVQPEVRYWFRDFDNDGWFVGAHLEMEYYNFAFDGKYRYQDYRGRTPALGGGLSAGFRKPISKDKRWRMEFTLGAGIYPLDYSIFDNTPDVKDGQWMARKKETYIGLDQVAITLAYSFDMQNRKKIYQGKGGRR